MTRNREIGEEMDEEKGDSVQGHTEESTVEREGGGVRETGIGRLTNRQAGRHKDREREKKGGGGREKVEMKGQKCKGPQRAR